MTINNQVVSDPNSGLVIKFENGKMTIWGKLPNGMDNRDFFFNDDGSYDGTGTSFERCPIKPDITDLLGDNQ